MADEKLIRSFIAIPLSDSIKSKVATIQNRLKPTLPDVRWVKPETMHLTLHFFGDLNDESLEKAGSVMVSIGSLIPPFSMTLSGIDAFPSPSRARVFWLGIKCDRINGLYAALETGLEEVGFVREKRAFHPHITLGRCRSQPQRSGHILSPETDTVAGEMTVDRMVLYESQLLPSGAVHRPRQTIHFTAG